LDAASINATVAGSKQAKEEGAADEKDGEAVGEDDKEADASAAEGKETD